MPGVASCIPHICFEACRVELLPVLFLHRAAASSKSSCLSQFSTMQLQVTAAAACSPPCPASCVLAWPGFMEVGSQLLSSMPGFDSAGQCWQLGAVETIHGGTAPTSPHTPDHHHPPTHLSPHAATTLPPTINTTLPLFGVALAYVLHLLLFVLRWACLSAGTFLPQLHCGGRHHTPHTTHHQHGFAPFGLCLSSCVALRVPNWVCVLQAHVLLQLHC